MRKILYYENILEFKKHTGTALHLAEIKNWQLCRTCLKETTDAADFSKTCIVNFNDCLVDVDMMLKQIRGLEQTEEEFEPTKTCKECVQKISTLYLFQIQMQRAKEVLQRLRGKLKEPQHSNLKSEFETEAEEAIVQQSKNYILDTAADKSAEYVNIANTFSDAEEYSLNSFEEEYLLEDDVNLNDEEDASVNIELLQPEESEEAAEIKPIKIQIALSDNLFVQYKCETCAEVFKLQSLLTTHIKNAHPKQKAYKCGKCAALFGHKQSLSRHMQKHQPNHHKHECEICNMKFQRSDNYTRHLRVHTGERPYACDICLKAFKQLGELKEHGLSHYKRKLFECDLCGHRLSSRNGLYVHKRSHTGIRKFACSSCNKRFLTSGELRSHENVHARTNQRTKRIL